MASGPDVRSADPRSASGSDALRQMQLQGQVPPGLRPGSGPDHYLRPGVDPRLIPSGVDHARLLASSGQDLRDAPLGPSGLVGRRVGPYRITALIAQGGMGAVYEAIHERLQRAVALKTLLPGADATSEDVQRFLNEARAAARLSHRNIVPIHDVGEASGVRYLAMELVRGETLHELVRRTGPLDERRALEILADAAEGLEHAHRSGIVHRDLKPANILLDSDGTPRVTDFGVAKARGNQRLTATGTALGTPSYMSPEQAMGQNESLDARSDVYGLGAILYECLTGRPPFDLGAHLQTMQAVVADPPTPPSELRPGLSPEVEAICLKCLEKRRDARYASCRELADDLRRCIAGRTVAARPPGRLGLALRRLRRYAGAVTLVAALGGGLAAGLALAAPRWLAARRVAALERGAADLAGERLRAADGTLAADDAGADALRSVAELTVEGLRRAVVEALAPGDDPARVAAVERGLAAVDTSSLSALRARALLRLAGGASDAEERDALLARAELLDPQGPTGRAARAESALALVRATGAAARAQALDELTLLARTLDEPGRRAASALVQALADVGRWSDVAAHAARLRAAAGPGLDDRAARLAQLAAALTPSLPLPDVDHLVVARAAEGQTLVFVDGASVWARRPLPGDRPEVLARPTDGARGVEGAAELRLVIPWDRDGDGQDELLVVTPQGNLGVVRLSGGGRAVEWGPQLAEAPNGFAAGDFDGDGHDDVAVTFWENGPGSVLIKGGGAAGRWQFAPVFPGGDPARRFGINDVAMLDLDGDGRDEVVLGGSQFSQTVEVFGWDPERGFVSRARLPAGVVRDTVVYPVDDRREGLLVIVDAARDHAERDLGDPPWRGRDGLLLVEAPGDATTTAVVARWTYGPDEPPSAASRTLAEQVQGFMLPLDGVPHVGRAAWVDGKGWCLELTPRQALSLKANAAPVVACVAPAPPPSRRRLRLADLDGDRAPEVLLGGALLGLGDRPLPADPYEGTPEPAAESTPAALLRVSRKLAALGRTDAARGLVERLRREHPDAWAASAGALLLLEPAFEAAREADEEARRAFARLDVDVGERRREEARRAWSDAAGACAALAGDGAVAPRDALAAWERAADAFDRAGDRSAAIDALRRALAVPGLEAEAAARLRARVDALRRVDALVPLDVDPTQADVRAALLVSDPLRCTAAGPSITLRCAPDSDEWAVVPLALAAAPPLVVEATVRLHGQSWATHVEAGLFEPQVGELGPDRLTGVRFGLWDVSTRKASCRVVVAGQQVGPVVRLPGFEGAFTCRLELSPLERGGVRARVRLADEDGRALLDEDVTVDAAPGPQALAGLRSPPHGNSEAVVEQGLWAMETRATLERLRVHAPRPRLAPVDALQGAHAALALDDAAAARRSYDHRIKRAADPEALFHRGLARGRLGDPAAFEDIVEAARRAPYRTIIWLEDLADALPSAHPGYTAAIGAALRAMAASPRPLPQALGRQLLGELDVALERLGEDPSSSDDPGAEAEVQEAAIYLNMRCAHNPQRWRQYPIYQRLVPGGRYARKSLPRIIPAPAGDPEVERAELDAARERGDGGCLLEQVRQLTRARLAGSPTPEAAAVQLASFLSNQGAYGMAEGVARELLDRPSLSPQAESNALLVLARAYAAQGREEQLAAAFQRLRLLGALSTAQLDEFEQSIRGQLNAVGPVLQDAHRGR